jgi:hypothetical protein
VYLVVCPSASLCPTLLSRQIFLCSGSIIRFAIDSDSQDCPSWW